MSPIFVPIIAIAFSLLNIAHFGTHILPRTDTELIADGICLILWAQTIIAWNAKT